jgi:CheY-like chemotaxis protein
MPWGAKVDVVRNMKRNCFLIIEDDLATLYALRTLFERRGCAVATARTVAEALNSLEPAPDWIILDLYLPDGDGADVLQWVRAAGLPSRVAIVSGILSAMRVQRLLALKPDLVMNKPVDFVRLLSACCGAAAAVRGQAEWGDFGSLGGPAGSWGRDGKAILASAG